MGPRSSSREVRVRVPDVFSCSPFSRSAEWVLEKWYQLFSAVYFSRGSLPTKKISSLF